VTHVIRDIEFFCISVVADPPPGCEFRVHPADVIGDGANEVPACGEGRGSAPEGAGSDLAQPSRHRKDFR
jgi:hypothetical protein